MEMKEVVTVFLEKGGKILLLRRSHSVGSHQGLWGGVSGYVEAGETPLEAAGREVAEEVGIQVSRMSAGEKIVIAEEDVVWSVHPFLAQVDGEPVLDWEHDEHAWIKPEEMARYDTVPGLAEAYASAIRGHGRR